jgi:hypothetical protein
VRSCLDHRRALAYAVDLQAACSRGGFFFERVAVRAAPGKHLHDIIGDGLKQTIAFRRDSA